MNELRISRLNITQDILYGRETEITQVQDALSRVVSDEEFRRSEMLLISGSSGTGKSVLARQLKRPTERIGGYFVSGKFDQNRLLPYSAFREAFDQLCGFLRDDNDVKEAVREALGSDGARVLADVVPGVAMIVQDEKELEPKSPTGVEVHGESGGYMETQNLFNYVIRSFLKTVSNPERPVVILLDDLQWADEPSLDLLETLVTDSEEDGGLLFLICYRDKEFETPNDALKKRLDSITEQSKNVVINLIHLENLTKDAVQELVAEMLRADIPETSDLAELVFDKTHGNAFFVKRFLQSLKDEDILTFNVGTFKWRYSLEKVRRQSVTDNVANFMIKSMQKLPLETQQVLTIASCLGAQFDVRTLRKVVENDSLDEVITECVDLGLLDEVEDKVKYCFVHDQIQSAAKALIPEKGLPLQQLQIGVKLLSQSTEEDVKRDIFIIVDLLNNGVQHTTDDEELRHRLTMLNYHAGQRSMSLAAFKSALSYLEIASGLLAESGWKQHYEICVDLFSLAAEAAYCTGDFDRLHHYVDEVLKHADKFQHKFRVYHALTDSLGSEAKYTEAVDTGLLALKQLGYHFPNNPGKLRVVVELMKTKQLLKKYSQDDLENLPVMRDENIMKAMKIIDKMGTYAYLVRPNLLAVLIFCMVQWSIQYGVCKNSGSGFVGYGMIISSALCDLKGAYMFGQVGRAIVKRLGAKDLTTRVDFMTVALINHWTQPAAQTIKPLLLTFQDGLATTGDIENSMWSLQFAQGFMIESGHKLSHVHESYKNHEDVIKDYSQEIIWIQSFPWWQYVQNLMGLSENALLLTGDVMNEQEMLQRARADKDPLLECFLYFLRSWLACYFNKYESAVEFINRARPLESAVMSQHWCPRHAFFVGLASFASCRQKKRRRHNWKPLKSKQGDASIRKLKKWILQGNCNCVHLNLLLEAERLALTRKDTTKAKFDEAIASASKRGYIQDKALASERAGLFFLDQQDEEWASHYLSMSRELYSSWGAKAKVDQMDRKYSNLLKG